MEHQVHNIALEYKKDLLAKLTELSTASHAIVPEVLGAGLKMLMNGAWNAARMFGPDNHAKHMLAAARALIAAQVK